MVEFIIGALVLGLIPGAIAYSRGLPFITGWGYGALIWPVALLFAKPGSVTIAGVHTCPFCAKSVLPKAKVCKHCHGDLPEPPKLRLAGRAVRLRSLGWWDGDMSDEAMVAMGAGAPFLVIAFVLAFLWLGR
jgi:hypothetical protein